MLANIHDQWADLGLLLDEGVDDRPVQHAAVVLLDEEISGMGVGYFHHPLINYKIGASSAEQAGGDDAPVEVDDEEAVDHLCPAKAVRGRRAGVWQTHATMEISSLLKLPFFGIVDAECKQRRYTVSEFLTEVPWRIDAWACHTDEMSGE